MDDCNIGEMFLNFILDPVIITHTGVDFTRDFKEERKGFRKE